MTTKNLVGALCSPSPDPDGPEVQLLIGQMYLNKGQFAQAFGMFAVAAQSGQAQALTMLGRAYEQGWGVKRSVAQAVKYFMAAAEQGDGWACFNLGDLYLSGDGLEENPELAFQYYVQAACKGVSKALNMLGTLCENGMLTAQPDKAQARLYFKAGAEAQDCWAAFNMGRLALEEEDYVSAAQWFECSLPHGFPDYWRTVELFLRVIPMSVFQVIADKAQKLLFAATRSRQYPLDQIGLNTSL